ncbi:MULTISPECIES: hypothetical protein [Gammaproteobacteria]|uniref:hypothetical protein n=1 Tax=Gammaproteobacteria TaxID=1236 RepID=UPI0018671AA5|nr:MULTISPECIES: hypothetical protein [Gammaproteobacteria]
MNKLLLIVSILFLSSTTYAAQGTIKLAKDFKNIAEYVKYLNDTIVSSEQCSELIDSYNNATLIGITNYALLPDSDALEAVKNKCSEINKNATEAIISGNKIAH